jgi:hypothetical protein
MFVNDLILVGNWNRWLKIVVCDEALRKDILSIPSSFSVFYLLALKSKVHKNCKHKYHTFLCFNWRWGTFVLAYLWFNPTLKISLLIFRFVQQRHLGPIKTGLFLVVFQYEPKTVRIRGITAFNKQFKISVTNGFSYSSVL